MLPPIDPTTASANPKFDALYRDLCENKLNPDGSTKLDANAQKERDVFQEELQKGRVSATKSALIKTRLHDIAARDDELPIELRELVGVITAIISTQLPAEDMGLLRGDVEAFKENISPIAKALSTSIQADLTSLSHVLGSQSNQNILPEITRLKTSIQTSMEDLATLRQNLTHETLTLHTLYRKILETCIRLLEQTIHGSVARNTKTKAEYLSTVAEGMARKLQLQQNQLLRETRSEEVEVAIREREEGLEREIAALRRQVRERRGLLEEYREGGGTRGMVEEYGRILAEGERVMGEIERLEQERR